MRNYVQLHGKKFFMNKTYYHLALVTTEVDGMPLRGFFIAEIFVVGATIDNRGNFTLKVLDRVGKVHEKSLSLGNLFSTKLQATRAYLTRE